MLVHLLQQIQHGSKPREFSSFHELPSARSLFFPRLTLPLETFSAWYHDTASNWSLQIGSKFSNLAIMSQLSLQCARMGSQSNSDSDPDSSFTSELTVHSATSSSRQNSSGIQLQCRQNCNLLDEQNTYCTGSSPPHSLPENIKDTEASIFGDFIDSEIPSTECNDSELTDSQFESTFNRYRDNGAHSPDNVYRYLPAHIPSSAGNGKQRADVVSGSARDDFPESPNLHNTSPLVCVDNEINQRSTASHSAVNGGVTGDVGSNGFDGCDFQNASTEGRGNEMSDSQYEVTFNRYRDNWPAWSFKLNDC